VIVYLDSSALLRLILREPGALDLADLARCESILSSELLAVECPRTLDRLRLQGSLSVEEAQGDSVTAGDRSADVVTPPFLAA
jgi:predicted nucleic acid-binding protein